MSAKKYDEAEAQRLIREAREDDDAITRTRNNLRAMADQLEASRARIAELEAPRPRQRCTNYTPSGFSGHWIEWHRGHGCDKDDGRQRSPDAAREIEALEIRMRQRR